MSYAWNAVTESADFYGRTTPAELIGKYGSPLYVYNEGILRKRCREMRQLVKYPRFAVNYSVKANANLSLLKIVREEGLMVDAISQGEVAVELAAGFDPSRIFFVGNNVSREELAWMHEQGVRVCVDSLSQLELFGQVAPGADVSVRLNTGVGAGHHEMVVTGGHETKFAIDPEFYGQMQGIADRHGLKIIGIHQHIGSQIMEPEEFLKGVRELLPVCMQFPELELIDLGGGLGIPYHKMDGEARLDLESLGRQLDELLFGFAEAYGREVEFKIEPGRYISAECGVLLGKVHTIKSVYENHFVGTDLGFNVLVRPMMYDAWHDVEIYRPDGEDTGRRNVVSIVGNICESGDILASKREMPEMLEGDILGVLDAGAYGYSMASNYNNRLRPAEVLIDADGNDRLIRRRDTVEDLLRGFEI